LATSVRPAGGHPRDRLTAAIVKRLGPGRYADGGGLYLEVRQTGARRWFLRVMIHGRRRDIGLGATSLVSLAEAREEARRLRKAAKAGLDPIAERDCKKRRSLSFEEAARQVHRDQILTTARNAKAAGQWINSLRDHPFPTLGQLPVNAVTQSDILRVLSPIWTERRAEPLRSAARPVRTPFRVSLAEPRPDQNGAGGDAHERRGDGPGRTQQEEHPQALGQMRSGKG